MSIRLWAMERNEVDKDVCEECLGGRYLLKRLIGQGGMGQVFEGEHLITGRKVAIKKVDHQVLGRSKTEARLLTEIRALTRVRHSGVIDLLDAGRDTRGQLFLVFELLEGATLQELLLRQVLRVPDLLRIVSRVLDALSAIHRSGVVHRDIKPSNIFLTKSASGRHRVKLLDFGIAKFAEPLSETTGRESTKKYKGITQDSTIVGTMDFISPEQALCERVDARSDIYSVGATLFFALAGRPPFVESSVREQLISLATKNAPPISDLVPEIFPKLAAIVDKALEKKPEERFATAEAMRLSLESVIGPLQKIKSTILPLTDKSETKYIDEEKVSRFASTRKYQTDELLLVSNLNA